MTGSLRQRGIDSWELRVYLGIDPERERGRERWATKTVHGTRRYATACLAEFVEEAGYARLRAGTVADLLDRWLTHASTAWSASTLRETRSIVEHHLKPHLGHLAVNKLATLDIDDLYRHLLRSGGHDGRPLAPGTVHRVHVVLHRALTQAVRWEWVWLNPASAASPPRVPPAEVRPPSPDQVHRLFASVEDRDPDFATYLWLAASTGARRSQLLGLRWSEIDVAHAAMGFSRAFVEGPAGPVLRATKSHRSYRVAIDCSTIRQLVAHRRRAEARAVAHGLHLGDSAFVFSSRADGSWPWLPNRVTKTFLAHRRHAGVGRFRLHDLRHFMATQMLNAGVPVPTVSERLGHARASTTLNIYGHWVPGADHAAAVFISTLIAPNDDTMENDPGEGEAPMAHDIDLTADLNAQDDDGLGWSTLADARNPLRVHPGAMLLAGNRHGRAVVRIVAVDDDGQVHFSALPGSVAQNRHLLGRSVR
jgi:integrase